MGPLKCTYLSTPGNLKNGWLHVIKGKLQSLPINFILIVTILILFVHLPRYRSTSSGITTQIIEPATTSAVVMANQVTGQSSVRNNQSDISSPFSSLPRKDDQINFSQGKLNRNIKFWKEVIRPSEFVSNIVEFGYKIPFHTTPVPFRINNRSSSLQNWSFVEKEIQELLDNGCISEVIDRPEFINPLRVASQSSGKKRLILDLSHLNNYIVKTSVRYEDLRTVIQLLKKT